MKRQVYISSFNVLAPAISNPKDLEDFLLKYDTDNDFIPAANSSYPGTILFDEKNKFYPKRPELKSMRKDVLASVICVSELLERSGISPDHYPDIPYFICSGCFLSEIAEIIDAMKEFHNGSDIFYEPDKQANTYEMIPPLASLRTLTNAIESFSSISTGLAGDNTSFGSTSAAGFYALKTAWQRIAEGKAEIAIAGGADIGEGYARLMFKNFTDESDDWRNSACSVFFILESKKSINKRGVTPLAEIIELTQAPKPPSFFEPEMMAPYSYFQSAGKLDSYTVFGGGLNKSDYEKEKKAITLSGVVSTSLYPLLGSLGSASLLMSVAAAICLSKNMDLDKSTALDRDAFLREFMVELAHPNCLNR